MIELYACDPLSAEISQEQCVINRRREISACLRCSGLGELVRTVDGLEQHRPAWGRSDYSSVGGCSGKASKREMRMEAIERDRMLGGALVLEEIDERGPRILTVDFDLDDDGDLALIKAAEEAAYEHGITLGDEILCRLRVMDGVM